MIDIELCKLSFDLSDKKHRVPGQSPAVMSTNESAGQPVFLCKSSSHNVRFSNVKRHFRIETYKTDQVTRVEVVKPCCRFDGMIMLRLFVYVAVCPGVGPTLFARSNVYRPWCVYW